jgi:hypothetical protein
MPSSPSDSQSRVQPCDYSSPASHARSHVSESLCLPHVVAFSCFICKFYLPEFPHGSKSVPSVVQSSPKEETQQRSTCPCLVTRQQDKIIISRKVALKYLENVAQFRNLGTTVTDHTCKTCYHALHIVLLSHELELHRPLKTLCLLMWWLLPILCVLMKLREV